MQISRKSEKFLLAGAKQFGLRNFEVWVPIFIKIFGAEMLYIYTQKTEQNLLHFISVTESKSEPVEPKLFETWSWSGNDLFNKYLLQSIWKMQG